MMIINDLFAGDKEYPLSFHLALGRRHLHLRHEELCSPLDMLRMRGVDEVFLLLGCAIPAVKFTRFTGCAICSWTWTGIQWRADFTYLL